MIRMNQTRKESCPNCFGTGRGGYDDENGVYHYEGNCGRCGGRGFIEYTIPEKEETCLPQS